MRDELLASSDATVEHGVVLRENWLEAYKFLTPKAAAHLSEIARADDAVKAAYQTGLLEIHARLCRLTATPEDAWTLMAQNVGAVMLARAVPDEALQREILSALRQAGETLLADRSSHSTGLRT